MIEALDHNVRIEVAHVHTDPKACTSGSKLSRISRRSPVSDVVEDSVGIHTMSVRPSLLLDYTASVTADPEDPRTRGEGPCGMHHDCCVESSNSCGSWFHCAKCDLRLKFIPNKNRTAKSLRYLKPQHVRAALKLLKSIDLFDSAMQKDVHTAINIVKKASTQEEIEDPDVHEMRKKIQQGAMKLRVRGH